MKQYIKLLTSLLLSILCVGIAYSENADEKIFQSGYLDYEMEDIDPNQKEFAIPPEIEYFQTDSTMIVDVTVKGVWLYQSQIFNGFSELYMWNTIPCFEDGWPCILNTDLDFNLPLDTDTANISVEVLQADYKDFKCRLAPTIQPRPWPTGYEPVDIVPYSGFKPENLIEFWYVVEVKNAQFLWEYSYKASFALFQYDYENEILRAYTHIRFKYNYKKSSSSIDGIVTDVSETTPEYYNLQGVKIANPTPGTICIERRGSHARKIKL